jgi:cell division protein FtsW
MTANVTSITRARAAAVRSATRTRVNNRTATVMMVVAFVLIVIGLAATLSASSTVGLARDEGQYSMFVRQLVGVGLGTVAMLVAARVPFRLYRRMAVPLFLLTLVLLVWVLVDGVVAGGSRRWIAVGPLPAFQPSELAKFTVIVALATVMERKHRLLGDFGHFLAPVAMILGTTGLLVMLQPDLGTTIVIAACAIAVLLASSAPFRYVALTGFGGVVVAGALAVAAPYRFARITGFLEPWADPAGNGYQLIQSYLALGTGGIFGVGLGNSRARWFYLPNAHTDFIFSIVGEETGFIGGVLVILLFVVLALSGWATARRAPDSFGRMMAAGITTWFSFQAIVNIGGVVGVLPITGITLPFVSFGSTALVVSMAALGVLVNVAQQGTAPRS